MYFILPLPFLNHLAFENKQRIHVFATARLLVLSLYSGALLLSCSKEGGLMCF